MRIKIFRSIFAAVNLALISGGLVSCVEVPQPLAPTEQQKPVLQPNQQPNQTNQNEEDDDDKDGDRKNDKDDDDKDDND
ncbi:DNA-directed RNA polymerase, sigma subunit [Nostoc flagelliforme CCNUN1]|uniref:DNA-directed RNA polymerase, sigma subunit n=1 Tax=Nostoc flagelliforme CCNUN1 TaxID=2038116 RepID=A0A2K8STU3_9NOSO|nr:hypothetical protein [Nostoc flagelliforme]AUB38876.1 DNA-directed RNA polymerase, sigma subunit [Nostoc flagelliforme CCNUN1]